MTGGSAKGKHVKEKDEEQFILRLPEPLAEQMRLGLGSKNKRESAGSEAKFAVHFTSEREAVFLLNGARYPATLRDFPCIVETHKTADKRTYFKSADVHQVLVVRMPDDPPPPENPVIEDGMTPPAKGAGVRFHIPPTGFSDDQVETLESHMKYVVDNKVQFVRKKTPATAPVDDSDDVIIEADAGDPSPTVSAADPAAPSVAATPMSPFTAPSPLPGTPAPGTAPGTPAPVGAPSPSPAPQTPAGAGTPAEGTPAVSTPAVSTPAAEGTASVTPGPAASPTPPAAEVAANAEEEDDDDDFADMLAGEMLEEDGDTAERTEEETRKRLERTTLDGKIEEQKTKISGVQEQAAGAPNPVIKRRILAKVPDLEAELKKLEEARAALD